MFLGDGDHVQEGRQGFGYLLNKDAGCLWFLG